MFAPFRPTVLLAAFALMTTDSTPALSAHRDAHGDPLPKDVRFRLGTLRFRHAATVNKLVWMPDGKNLVSASYNDPARLWRVADGKELRRINETGRICGLAITRDGRLMAWGDGGVHIAEAATGKEIRLLKEIPFSGEVGGVNFSPDGKMLVVYGLVGSRTQIYAVDSGKKLLDFAGNQYGASVFSPDSKSILVGTSKGVLCLNVATGAEKRTLTTEGGDVFSPVFSPDGRKLAAADEVGKGLIWVWSWPEGKLLHRLRCTDAIIREIAYSPDGKTLATAGDRGHGLRIWDLVSGKQRHHLPAHENHIHAVAFSPDGSLLASGGDNRCVSLWDMRSAKEPRLLTKNNRRFTAVTSTPDGKMLATAERDGSVVLWDAHDGHDIRRLESWDRVAAKLTISPDGKWLAACAEFGPVGLWDLGTGRRKPAPSSVPATIGCAAFSPDSATVALGDEKGFVHVCAMKTGATVHTIRREPPKEQPPASEHFEVRALDWSANGGALAIGYWDGGFTLYDPLRGRKFIRWPGPKRGGAFAFSADGRLLALVAGDSSVRVYEIATGQEIQRTSVTRLRIISVAFAPDGRTLALGGGTSLELHYYNHYFGIGPRSPGTEDFSIRPWDLVEKKELRCLTGHALQVESLAFSPDGTRLVSGSADATPLGWDVAALTRRPAKTGLALSASRLTELWADLANRDAVQAQKAVGELVRSPDTALAMLAGKLTPVPAPPRQRIRALLADLDSDEFVRRDRATRELEHLGEIAAPTMRKILKEKPSLEARKRIESLLEALDAQAMTPEHLRAIRALQVLEHIGTSAAQRNLEDLANGADGARLTQDAKASLRRLARRSVEPGPCPEEQP